MTKKPDHYVSDVPIAGREADRLRRWPFAERIANTLATRSDPASLVVGVYGRWGEGKTTVLEFVEQQLREHENVVTIRFNPWLFRNDAELFASFFELVAAAIDRKLANSGVGALLREYKDAIVGGATLLGHAAQLFGGIPFGGTLAKTAASAVVGAAGGPTPGATAEELRGKLERVLAEAKKRVVVLFDDIDRLDKTEAQAVFRLVKVAADFQWTSYVLALDPDVVTSALAERYPGRPEGGDEFLDKIVQVPLRLPPAPEELLRTLLFADIDRVLDDSGVTLSDTEARRLVTELSLRVMGRVKTLRALKRYINALQFALPLLKNEVNTVDLFIIEALRIFHPKLHAVVLRHAVTMLDGGADLRGQRSSERVQALRDDLNRLTDRQPHSQWFDGRAEALLLGELFPRTQSIFSNTHFGAEWDERWAKAKRIASARHFPRYFASGVPPGQARDADIVAVLGEPNIDAAEGFLRTTLRDASAESVVQQLIEFAWNLSDADGERLARVVARVAEDLPQSNDIFGQYTSPRARASILVARLLARQDQARRVVLSNDVLRAAPQALHARVFRLLQPATEPSSNPDAVALTESEWQLAGATLAARIAETAKTSWLFESEGAAWLARVWGEFGTKAELQSYVTRWVDEDHRRALDVVRAFGGVSQVVSTGERHVQPLGPEQVEGVAQLLGSGSLTVALTTQYGSVPPDWTPPRVGVGDADLAYSFLYHRARVLSATGATPALSRGGDE